MGDQQETVVTHFHYYDAREGMAYDLYMVKSPGNQACGLNQRNYVEVNTLV